MTNYMISVYLRKSASARLSLNADQRWLRTQILDEPLLSLPARSPPLG